MNRPPWDSYFLGIAHSAATRSTCDRAHVGAVLMVEKDWFITGYNGSLPGEPHCDDVGHLMIFNHCLRTIHAEVNAIQNARKRGMPTRGATLYCTHCPCDDCASDIVRCGIRRVVYTQGVYVNQKALEILKEASIEYHELEPISISRNENQ